MSSQPGHLLRILIILSIRVLPLTGPDRNQEIQHLMRRGISDVQGKEEMDHLARELFNIVWKPIESSIAQIIQLSGPDASKFFLNFDP